ncbi:chloride channel protein [Dawidia soli]|uniref:Chloride channel protein n=1 Tax=Dawidia soli TaxID=2782352 RepID=A0AAP2DEF1_9BACT|nr:chloride channel protein [Dawidia soli]MBT1687867.1 chloride channel protein [Dawidia soli]
MIRRVHGFVSRLMLYVREKLSVRQFFILSSIIVGLSSGLAAIILKYFVHSIERLVVYYSHNYEEFFLFTLFPMIGIGLTVFYVQKALKGEFKKGTAEIAYAIAKKSSVLPSSQMYTHLVTAALTVGFGGSTGLESPMVTTGSAIGSNYGRTYRLSYKERTILLACGAASGIAAAFSSPIAGVLFAIEVLLTDVSASAFIPLIISAACGALLSKIILAQGVVLSFALTEPFNYYNVPWYIALGVLTGLLSLYFARTFEWVTGKMRGIGNNTVRVIIGGVCLMLLLLIFPPLFGEGYETIKVLSQLKPAELAQNSIFQDAISSESILLIFLGGAALLKCVAAALTIGSGGNGGSFGPSLFMGAYLGFIFARVINLSGLTHIPETNFALVGMAGLLAGVFYAPLTAVFLIAEITGGYELMIPLMLVAAISTVVTHYVEPLSMEGKKLSLKLRSPIEDRDKSLLSRLELMDLIEKNFSVIRSNESLQDLVKAISISKRNIFPVLNDNELVGLVYLDNVRNIIFKHDQYEKVWVRDLMSPLPAVISPQDNFHTILKKFEETNQWNLPVVDNTTYLGFVSKSSILTKYREELLQSV